MENMECLKLKLVSKWDIRNAFRISLIRPPTPYSGEYRSGTRIRPLIQGNGYRDNELAYQGE
jgi:hypothetical protein